MLTNKKFETKILASTVRSVVIVFTATFCLRLWFLARVQVDPAFHIPVFDPKEFNFWAYQLLHNNWTWHSLQNHTPLYAYFLAVLYKLFGFKVIIPALVQSFLAALGTCLMFLLARRLVGTIAAVVCAALMAGYWWFIYTQIYLFSENLAMFINIVLVCHLVCAKDSWMKFFWGGLLLGLSVLCRPDILLFAFLVWFWIGGRCPDRRRQAGFYVVFLSGLLLVLAPVLLRNHQLTGSWLLRSQIGANLYIGNNPEFQGSNIFLEQGRPWQKFITLPYTELRPGRKLSEAQINDFFIGKTQALIREHPFRWMGFMARKACTVLSGREFLRSEDVYFRDRFVRDTPLAMIKTGWIFALAFAGLLMAWRQKQLSLVILFLASLIPVVFFPAKTRYLVPIMPFLMLLVGVAVSAFWQGLRQGDRRQAGMIVGVFFSVLLLAKINPLQLREPDVSETYYALASNLQYQRNYILAERSFLAAVTVNPQNCSAWVDLGVMYIWLGRYEDALVCFRRGDAIEPVYGEYVAAARSMLEGQQSSSLVDRLLSMEEARHPAVRGYLKFFHYP